MSEKECTCAKHRSLSEMRQALERIDALMGWSRPDYWKVSMARSVARSALAAKVDDGNREIADDYDTGEALPW